MAPRLLLLVALPLSAQLSNVLSVQPPPPVPVQKGHTFTVDLPVTLRSGFHANTNAPADEYLIPLKLTWEKGVAESTRIDYPKGTTEKFAFSNKPMAVYTGTFKISSEFKVAASAPPGPASIQGKLRYQACNNSMCLPPRTLDVKIPIEVR